MIKNEEEKHKKFTSLALRTSFFGGKNAAT
jgi:hypothetical protein